MTLNELVNLIMAETAKNPEYWDKEVFVVEEDNVGLGHEIPLRNVYFFASADKNTSRVVLEG